MEDPLSRRRLATQTGVPEPTLRRWGITDQMLTDQMSVLLTVRCLQAGHDNAPAIYDALTRAAPLPAGAWLATLGRSVAVYSSLGHLVTVVDGRTHTFLASPVGQWARLT